MEEFLHFILLPETFYGIINNIHVAARAIYIVKKIRGTHNFRYFYNKIWNSNIYIYLVIFFITFINSSNMNPIENGY